MFIFMCVILWPCVYELCVNYADARLLRIHWIPDLQSNNCHILHQTTAGLSEILRQRPTE